VHNLDGDALRHGLNRDLGFSDADRVENIRRVGELARLFNHVGMIVLVAAISPFARVVTRARTRRTRRFVEVHVDTPLEVAEERTSRVFTRERDPGSCQISPHRFAYEAPLHPEVHIDSSSNPPKTPDEVFRSSRNGPGVVLAISRGWTWRRSVNSRCEKRLSVNGADVAVSIPGIPPAMQ